jgi:hypothetical protein
MLAATTIANTIGVTNPEHQKKYQHGSKRVLP